jgi:hypothetical protein
MDIGLSCSTKRLINLNLQFIWIMTDAVISMIERAPQHIHSSCEAQLGVCKRLVRFKPN